MIGSFVALLNLRSTCTFSVSLGPSNLLRSSFILHLSDGETAAQRSAEIGPRLQKERAKRNEQGLKDKSPDSKFPLSDSVCVYAWPSVFANISFST